MQTHNTNLKKLVTIAVLSCFISVTASAQVVQKPVPAVKQNVILKPIPSQPPEPAKSSFTKSSAPGTQNTLVYRLTAVRASIKTGNDNKEYPSGVRTTLGVRGSNMDYAFFVQENLKNEMRSNSDTEFGLEKRSGNSRDITLDALQEAGFHFRISYSANFQFDAWKIEGVSVTLEFRDQNGELHPTLAKKTITFGNANGFLNGYPGTTTMVCHTDGYFNPLSARIE